MVVGLGQAAFPGRLQFRNPVLFENLAAFRVIIGRRRFLARHRRVDILFLSVIEEGVERIIFLLADGIELVVVALGATGRQTEPRRREGVGAIDDLLKSSFVAIAAAFAIGERVAQKTSGHAIVGGGSRQQVAGDLLD